MTEACLAAMRPIAFTANAKALTTSKPSKIYIFLGGVHTSRADNAVARSAPIHRKQTSDVFAWHAGRNGLGVRPADAALGLDTS